MNFPRCVYLETSVRCNARCPMCPSLWLTRPDMSLAHAKNVVDQCAEHSVDEFHPFQYADPLVWPEFRELMSYVSGKLPNTTVVLYTNAGLLDYEMSRFLVGLGVSMSITFSVDGTDKETYEMHRPPLKWEKVLSNIRTFLEINDLADGAVQTRAHMTLTPENQHQAATFAAFWANKVKSVTFHERDSRAEQYGGPKRLYTQSSLQPCGQPFNGIFIFSDGEVGMCCVDTGPADSLGNVFEQSIEEIWNGEKFQRVRDLHLSGRKLEIPLCRNCSVRF